MQLIGTLNSQALSQVFENRAFMIAVRGDDIPAAALWLQLVLAHQATDLLGVHHNTLMAQCRAHPPVTVQLELVADRADPFDNVVLRRRDRKGELDRQAIPWDRTTLR
jgi:hypothetical protein